MKLEDIEIKCPECNTILVLHRSDYWYCNNCEQYPKRYEINEIE